MLPITDELEASQPLLLAVLRTLILSQRDNRHEKMFGRLSSYFRSEVDTKVVHRTFEGYLIKCYKLTALQ